MYSLSAADPVVISPVKLFSNSRLGVLVASVLFRYVKLQTGLRTPARRRAQAPMNQLAGHRRIHVRIVDIGGRVESAVGSLTD